MKSNGIMLVALRDSDIEFMILLGINLAMISNIGTRGGAICNKTEREDYLISLY